MEAPLGISVGMIVPIVSNHPDSNFPKALNFTETDPLTQLQWHVLFNRAFQQNVTDYVIGITEIESEVKANSKPEKIFRKEYHIYDGIALNNYRFKNPSALDPLTQCIIQKVHYFALKCFDLNFNGSERIVGFPQKFQFNSLEFVKDSPEMLDAFNYHATEQDIVQVGKWQCIIGDAFSNDNNKPESLRWLACSATKSPTVARRLKNELGPRLFQKLMKEMEKKN